jgi:hypothetical protein
MQAAVFHDPTGLSELLRAQIVQTLFVKAGCYPQCAIRALGSSCNMTIDVILAVQHYTSAIKLSASFL